jgi:hypothetical protein
MREATNAVEQVSLRLLFDNVREEFQQSLHSVAARFVLWGSFSDSFSLQNNYFEAKDKRQLIDRRRTEKSLTVDELYLKDLVAEYADEADKFRNWLVYKNRQPLLNEMLISYCTAFEACLKNTALVFSLAKNNGMDYQVFVPSPEFKKFLKEIKKNWNSREADSSKSRIISFFDDFIKIPNPLPGEFKFLDTSSPQWAICAEAFKLRNAIVHQLGRPSEQLIIGNSVFSPAEPAELKAEDLELIRVAMLKTQSLFLFDLL